MKVPTSKKIEQQKKWPEDSFILPETEGPESLDELVDVNPSLLLNDLKSRDYHQMVADFHSKFIELAKEKGLSFDDQAFPQINHVVIPDPLEFSITIDPTSDNSNIEARLDVFKKQVLDEVERRRNIHKGWEPQVITRHVKDKRGVCKDMKDLSAELDCALTAYRLGKPFEATAHAMGLIKDSRDNKECDSASKKVERYYKRAEHLIKAVAQGTFLQELSKPLRD